MNMSMSSLLESCLLGLGFLLSLMDGLLQASQWFVFHLLVCLRSGRRLLALLVKGTRTWTHMLARLLLFTLCLLPGWAALLKYFFLSPLVLRNVVYGRGQRDRNLLDLYLPLTGADRDRGRDTDREKERHTDRDKHSESRVFPDGAPVVVFVSGGAWIIGYKLWSALVARGLAALGVLVVVPDYRNFPQGDIVDMMSDIRRVLLWTRSNAHRFGGNPRKIVLAGQSAGAHICLCVLVEDFLRKCAAEDEELQQQGDGYQLDSMASTSATVTSTNSPIPAEEANITSHSSTGGEWILPTTPTCNTPIVDEIMNDEAPIQTGSHKKYDLTNGGFVDCSESLSSRDSEPELDDHLNRISFNDLKHVLFDETAVTPKATPTRHSASTTPSHFEQNQAQQLRQQDHVDGENVAPASRRMFSPQHPPLPINPHRLHSHHHRDREYLVDHVRLFIGVSGPYNLHALASHLHSRGLDSSILNWICRNDLLEYSPTLQLKNYVTSQMTSPFSNNSAVRRMKPEPRLDGESTDKVGIWSWAQAIGSALFTETESEENKKGDIHEGQYDAFEEITAKFGSSGKLNGLLKKFTPTAIFHGSDDKSIPLSISDELVSVLQSHGNETHYRVYDGWSHTDAILEAPLSGNSRLVKDMLQIIYKHTDSAEEIADAHKLSSSSAPMLHDLSIEISMVPEVLVRLARVLNPF